MDCEGFGNSEFDRNHDSRIFIFSLLLSSLLIYNSMGHIDENSLEGLSLISNIAQDILQKNNNEEKHYENNFLNNFPGLLWVFIQININYIKFLI